MAGGAILLAIGLCLCMFGTAYAACWFAWNLKLPPLAWIVAVIGIILTAGGIYACIDGAQEPGAW